MKSRIRKHPILVASTSEDAAIQELCAFNRKQAHKTSKKKSYILTCWGIKKTISKKEYEHYLSKGLNSLVKIEYE